MTAGGKNQNGEAIVALVLLVALLANCGPAATPTPTAMAPTVIVPTALAPTPGPQPDDNRLEERMSMVEYQIRRRGITDQQVLDAMERVPRHEFVPDQYQAQAYADRPLPIGHGQTISQPYIVALMTEILQLRSTDRVLEVGTGSGYQAAILGELVAEVYTVEIIEALASQAGERLGRLGYENVHVRHADGYFGWEEHAPFDAIIVTAAPDHIPQPLVAQLDQGARLVIPIGPPGGYQTLWEISKEGDEIKKRNVTGVLFVPLTGEH
ncbi:MAG: protein-L-isoaspartate(D-aspartate) O-methyltransferase [Anaerolineae bacterium]|jgi:protein-L-isoaspartate(D-aspartate) O-methyltransferase